MIIEDTLQILLRRIQPESVIRHWLNNEDTKMPLSLYPDKNAYHTALQTEFKHYSVVEAEYAYTKIQQTSSSSVHRTPLGVFSLIAYSVRDMLTTDSRDECLCKCKNLLKFRELTHTIDPMIFISAYLAEHDISHGNPDRNIFSWPPIVRTDNTRLHHILDNGMAENHFHVGGSVDSFIFSWICLMNHYSADRKNDFNKNNIDTYPLDTPRFGAPQCSESSYLLTFKAACIRYFLYQKLMGRQIMKDNKEISDDDWLIERLSISSDDECDQYTQELDTFTQALRSLCTSEFEDGFIPDYAQESEPLPPLDDSDLDILSTYAVKNYERRLYRPLSGEQRFQYFLFRAIYREEPCIIKYLDLAYAYLLIYCRLRGELVQVNDRVGFSNFAKYQDRKEAFTGAHFGRYDALRVQIAQQSVLSNPQIVSLEGRLCPSETANDLIEKIEYLYKNASESKFCQNSAQSLALLQKTKENAERKMHYVLHIPKKAQPISNNEDFETANPRDSKMRNKVDNISTAIIDAISTRPDIMSKVTGIDACSEEIDCRPEVFACGFRKIRQFRNKKTDSTPLPLPHITYHAGEDFLDPIDGLRAIDEAIEFCEMKGGDRLGHALALGIDCEEWYACKKNTVLLRKQTILDNMVWLYGKMHQYNIDNKMAEDQIQKQFKKYFTDIYTNNLTTSNSVLFSVDVMDYYASLRIRGNYPKLYEINPDANNANREKLEEILSEASQTEPWKLREHAGKNYDPLSTTLYHYYHFNFNMKKRSDEIVEYTVPRCILEAVCALQEKMQYDVSRRSIGIECNPSSNFLIGTFKDYLKHPIFRFNNKNLFPASDPRFTQSNPLILTSINTDDLGIFGTSLENEFALVACALEVQNDYCKEEFFVPPDNIYSWLNNIRKNGLEQSFIRGDLRGRYTY